MVLTHLGEDGSGRIELYPVLTHSGLAPTILRSGPTPFRMARLIQDGSTHLGWLDSIQDGSTHLGWF